MSVRVDGRKASSNSCASSVASSTRRDMSRVSVISWRREAVQSRRGPDRRKPVFAVRRVRRFPCVFPEKSGRYSGFYPRGGGALCVIWLTCGYEHIRTMADMQQENGRHFILL